MVAERVVDPPRWGRADGDPLHDTEAKMAQHRIVCTNQAPPNHPANQAHIVAVGIGARSSTYDRRLTIDEVLAAMDRGEVFFTVSESTGKVAGVHKFWCNPCNRYYIRSAPDAVHDNNLDSLSFCTV